MKHFGIVDLGSNTSRMVVYGYEPGRWYRLIDQIREPVRLGEGMGRGNFLAPAAIERAVAALKLYAHFAAATELRTLRVIATSALRDAANARLFFEQVKSLPLEIEVLSGPEEARLGVQAVANSFPFNEAWVMDLGGGSAQISSMKEREFQHGDAFPLGAVRLTEAHFSRDPPRRSEIAALYETVESHLCDIAKDLGRKAAVPLVAMGGTIRNLARAVQKRRNYPLGRLHGFFLKLADLEELMERLLELPFSKRRRVRGLHPDRADIILAGGLVYLWLLKKSKRDGLWISGYGVREGAFLEHFLKPPYRFEDVRKFSVENLFERYPQPRDHTGNVRRLARRLFYGLAPLHDLGPKEAELLDAAATLHDIGMVVGYHTHHKHGAYLVETSPLLIGFTHREHALLLLLVRYHRKGLPRWGRFRELAKEKDKKVLLYLVACLRLAEYLERARAGRVQDIRAWITRKTVTLELVATEDPAVEIWEARKQAPLFEQAFERRLILKRSNRGQNASPAPKAAAI